MFRYNAAAFVFSPHIRCRINFMSFSFPWLFTYITYSAAGAKRVRIHLIVDYLTSVFVMEDSFDKSYVLYGCTHINIHQPSLDQYPINPPKRLQYELFIQPCMNSFRLFIHGFFFIYFFRPATETLALLMSSW